MYVIIKRDDSDPKEIKKHRNTILFVVYQEKLQNLGQFPIKIKLEKLQKEK